ncbi:putative molybdenum transport system permease protein YvgM [Virgibacillus pantothenticus]|uniref:Molybdenum transport system permease n=2 Tax=Virgibacillus pantothenticus TaxID=1473 RepID=A0A0L0QUT8_VIRPA|nr:MULTISPECIES: molybdate ABC transporter permease subunit [Virgibacillus]API92572.1 molybdenum ABC transporter permease subunit [Virgibacillus sp. 6R]KNE22349.1 molybdenum ABC transporter permease [Virgibacillus pantothenticus]MBS7428058.1 molybdate ABC transporter permease subunit [Virgibacillus sp. 19R1-5]MBU8567790.1 molybdate ABC transporter permease subunit [Virgibacillus pantothenticus]MBU8601583.1 molybdate ABC transporter permease subunit [Virgibacillus pantothenticus]
MAWSWHPVQLSLVVASIATVIVFAFAIISVFWMTEKNVKGRAIIETIVFLPLVLPPTVIGFLLIMIFGNNSFVGQAISLLRGQTILFTVTAAIIAASVVAFPLMYQSLKTGFQMVDDNIRGAAKVDGASSWKLLFFITIPLSYRSIATGFILSFTRAFGEFGATLMFAGNIPGKTQTIPTAIYLAIESGKIEIAAYYALISIGFSFVLLFLMNGLTRNKEHKK